MTAFTAEVLIFVVFEQGQGLLSGFQSPICQIPTHTLHVLLAFYQ